MSDFTKNYLKTELSKKGIKNFRKDFCFPMRICFENTFDFCLDAINQYSRVRDIWWWANIFFVFWIRRKGKKSRQKGLV